MVFWLSTQGVGNLVALACLALGFQILAFQAGYSSSPSTGPGEGFGSFAMAALQGDCKHECKGNGVGFWDDGE